MVSKYSLLFDVKFQSMFPGQQKKTSEPFVTTVLTDDSGSLLLKEKTLDTPPLTPIKE